MSRSARLLDLIQAFRRHRNAVTAADLARDLGVSQRTLYRDIATLQAQGVPIEGEAGIGYVLRPGFMLPPLMFSDEEIEALMLGLRFVVQRGDPALARAAEDAAARIAYALPEHLRQTARDSGLLAAPPGESGPSEHLPVLRAAIRSEHRLRLAYTDKDGAATRRVVWPIAIGFFDHTRILAAWCETRADFRHFRTDRIAEAEALPDRYPRRRALLMRDWREKEGVREQLGAR